MKAKRRISVNGWTVMRASPSKAEVFLSTEFGVEEKMWLTVCLLLCLFPLNQRATENHQRTFFKLWRLCNRLESYYYYSTTRQVAMCAPICSCARRLLIDSRVSVLYWAASCPTSNRSSTAWYSRQQPAAAPSKQN